MENTVKIVLLSGGMDSSVLLHAVHREQPDAAIHAVSYHYGQKHSRELVCAAYQADAVGAQHRIIDISFFGELVKGGTTLVHGGGSVPDLDEVSDEELSQPPTYVPNRNMILLSIAAAYAETEGIRNIYYGAQAHDEYGYWDCTEEFLTRMNQVLALNRKTPVTIHAPFVEEKKENLVTLGRELGVDFANTWSCYKGGETSCRTCPTCVERQKAFAASGTVDPLL